MLNPLKVVGGQRFRGGPIGDWHGHPVLPEDRREHVRFVLSGRSISARAADTVCEIQLEDLSCRGASGVTEMVVAVGSRILVEIPGVGGRGAEVRWVQDAKVGFNFLRPLDLSHVVRIYADKFEHIGRIIADAKSQPACTGRAHNDS
jgi:hypothetical protein